MYDVKARHMAFTGPLGSIFWESFQNQKTPLLIILLELNRIPNVMQESLYSKSNEEKNCSCIDPCY